MELLLLEAVLLRDDVEAELVDVWAFLTSPVLWVEDDDEDDFDVEESALREVDDCEVEAVLPLREVVEVVVDSAAIC